MKEMEGGCSNVECSCSSPQMNGRELGLDDSLEKYIRGRR